MFTAIAQPIAGAITFRYLDAGGYHACGITTTEQLLCWGYNADGQLGLGTTAFTPTPTLVPGDYRYRRVVDGFYHSCAITLAAEAWCWGDNAGRAALGMGVPRPFARADPRRHGAQRGYGAERHGRRQAGAAPGAADVCRRGPHLRHHPRTEPVVLGAQSEGQLGRGGLRLFPVSPVPAGSLQGGSVGGLHTCAITSRRRWPVLGIQPCRPAWATERPDQRRRAGGRGRRPAPHRSGRDLPSPDPDFPLPPGPFLAAGYDHTCAITACRADRVLGTQSERTARRRLGAARQYPSSSPAGMRSRASRPGSGTPALSTPTAPPGAGATTASVSSAMADQHARRPRGRRAGGLGSPTSRPGELFTCGVTAEGVPYCWGDNEYGQLGDGSTRPSTQPVKVAFQP